MSGNHLTQVDLEHLRTLATAATPGPWQARPNELIGGTAVYPHDSDREVADFTSEPDARYIAAVDPLTVLKLVHELVHRERLAEASVLRSLLEDITAKATPHGEIDEPGGPYVRSYLLPTGPIHRALAYLRDGAVPQRGRNKP